jgi:hypothetical protein
MKEKGTFRFLFSFLLLSLFFSGKEGLGESFPPPYPSTFGRGGGSPLSTDPSALRANPAGISLLPQYGIYSLFGKGRGEEKVIGGGIIDSTTTSLHGGVSFVRVYSPPYLPRGDFLDLALAEFYDSRFYVGVVYHHTILPSPRKNRHISNGGAGILFPLGKVRWGVAVEDFFSDSSPYREPRLIVGFGGEGIGEFSFFGDGIFFWERSRKGWEVRAGGEGRFFSVLFLRGGVGYDFRYAFLKGFGGLGVRYRGLGVEYGTQFHPSSDLFHLFSLLIFVH